MHARLSRTVPAILSGVMASFLVVATPAVAQDDVVVRGVPEGRQMRLVSYRDLNLNLIAHRKILDNRVNRAVRQVCEWKAPESLAPDYRLCADQAWSGARPQITRAYVRAAQLAYGHPR